MIDGQSEEQINWQATKRPEEPVDEEITVREPPSKKKCNSMSLE